jgi:hypothetical protein
MAKKCIKNSMDYFCFIYGAFYGDLDAGAIISLINHLHIDVKDLGFERAGQFGIEKTIS